MKAASHKSLIVLFVIILLLLTAPFFQGLFNFVELAPLKGDIRQPEHKKLTVNNWFSAEYQLKEEDYLNDAFGFRSFFVRVNNQLAFSLFDKAKANGVVVGKKNYLYEKNYINAYYGTDYIGHDSIAHRIEKLRFIRDTLAKLNKNIIIIFAAGKGSFYPEYFPEKYHTEKGTTNYEKYVELAGKSGLNYIDFNRYFIDNKIDSKYPLYPQYGIHWSKYGMCLVADSMIRYIEDLRNIRMPHLYWDSVELDQPRGTDYDIADGMNIKFRLKSFEMAYPQVKFESDSGKIKPSVMVISDSYYWGIFDFGMSGVFSNDQFWFYNKKIYPESFKSDLFTSDVNLRKAIANHDVIILMATEATLPNLGWGFVERAYQMFTNPDYKEIDLDEFQEKVRRLRNKIKSSEEWMKLIESKANNKNISVDSMLTLDAIWIIKNEKDKK
ncbi:MAG: hypothetical protein WC341_10150 [Bacteroidales bacterium]|jgi:hypothetical protein